MAPDIDQRAVKALAQLRTGLNGHGTTESGALVTHIADFRRAADPADGADILNAVEAFVKRFVAYPSDAARIAHVLWIAHTHLMAIWDSTPRIAFLSPEPASGKTRALEVTELLVPLPIEAINVTAAYLFRKVDDDAGPPTILFDEIDTVFGPKAREHEDVRGLLNAGHRKGAVAGRCVVRGKTVETVEFPAYCAVAVAGLGDLPDTILTRSVPIRMRRRAPNERVEPFRRRLALPEGTKLHDQLSAWANTVAPTLEGVWPEMPKGVEDRDADVWEALLAVADAAGGDWPERARTAAVALVAASKESTPSLGIRLLSDVRTVFGDRDAMATDDMLTALCELPEAPWSEVVGGKPLNARGLAKRLGGYEVKSQTIRVGDKTPRGYTREALADAWMRYLPDVAGVADVSDSTGDEETATAGPNDATPATVNIFSSSRVKSETSATGATGDTESDPVIAMAKRLASLSPDQLAAYRVELDAAPPDDLNLEHDREALALLDTRAAARRGAT